MLQRNVFDQNKDVNSPAKKFLKGSDPFFASEDGTISVIAIPANGAGLFGGLMPPSRLGDYTRISRV